MIPLLPAHLTCEYRTDPRGIDAVHPRLSWQVQSPLRGERQTDPPRSWRDSPAASGAARAA